MRLWNKSEEQFHQPLLFRDGGEDDDGDGDDDDDDGDHSDDSNDDDDEIYFETSPKSRAIILFILAGDLKFIAFTSIASSISCIVFIW